MDRYLIESPHEEGEGKRLVKNVYAEGYLNHCDWGCKGGVHKASVAVIDERRDRSSVEWVCSSCPGLGSRPTRDRRVAELRKRPNHP